MLKNIKIVQKNIKVENDITKTYVIEEYEDTDEMLLIGISDLHYGLLLKDNLSENYKMEIAEERFNQILYDVIKRKQGDKHIEKEI